MGLKNEIEIVLSRHAIDRMRERDISVDEVTEVLQQGKFQQDKVWSTVMRFKKNGIIVVYDTEKGQVKTVFYSNKGNHYL